MAPFRVGSLSKTTGCAGGFFTIPDFGLLIAGFRYIKSDHLQELCAR
jgi:hypothetical protein